MALLPYSKRFRRAGSRSSGASLVGRTARRASSKKVRRPRSEGLPLPTAPSAQSRAGRMPAHRYLPSAGTSTLVPSAVCLALRSRLAPFDLRFAARRVVLSQWWVRFVAGALRSFMVARGFLRSGRTLVRACCPSHFPRVLIARAHVACSHNGL